MDIKKAKIENSERLVQGQLERALSLIKILPDNTFTSKKEGNKKGVMPTYMKANELKIEYSDTHNSKKGFLYIDSKNKYFGKSIGSVSIPENAKSIFITPESASFTFNECRYMISI